MLMELPNTKANSSTNMIGEISTNTSTSGTRLILITLRQAITAASLTAYHSALTTAWPSAGEPGASGFVVVGVTE